jgi:hypothetical protein
MLRDYFTQDVFTCILVLNLIFIVAVKQLFGARFADFLEINWNVKYLKIYGKEPKNRDVFNVLLFLNLILSLSVFSHSVYSNLVTPLPSRLTAVLGLCSAFAVLIVLKTAIEMMVARVFLISKVVKGYVFQKMAYLNFSGIVLILINFFLLFSVLEKRLIIYLGFLVIILINLSGFIRFLRRYQKTIIPNFSYFLLYLCTFEIAPYIILYKAINDYFS